jgi:hypothetical protein
VFLPFLEQNFPHLAENYRERYHDRAFLPPSYGKRLAQLVRRLRVKYKLTPDPRRNETKYAGKWPAEGFEEQMNLFRPQDLRPPPDPQRHAEAPRFHQRC